MGPQGVEFNLKAGEQIRDSINKDETQNYLYTTKVGNGAQELDIKVDIHQGEIS